MYKSECYNYDWFVDWLRHHLEPNLIPQLTITAEEIAQKFKRLYFDVTEEDVKHAMEEIGFTFVIKNNEYHYPVSFNQKAQKSIWKTFD